MRSKNVVFGCLAIPAALLLTGGLFVLVAWLKGPLPEIDHTGQQLEQTLPGSVARSVANPDSTSEPSSVFDLDGATVLHVELDLQDGEFDISPGAFGGSIQIDTDFPEGMYRLEPAWSERNGEPYFKLKFRGAGALQELQKVLHGQGHVDEPRLRVDLPKGVPMHLSLRVRKCAADIDLSGLSLLSLTFEHAMGSSQLVFREANPVTMEMFDIRAKMGELEMDGLGNAAARELAFRGRMGDFRLDFDGEWRHDTIASIDMMMGSATVRIPRNVQLQHDNRHVLFGGIETPSRSRPRDPEQLATQKSLVLSTSVRFGDVTLR